MKCLLVVLSMLYGADALVGELDKVVENLLSLNVLVPGCDAQLIKRIEVYPYVPLKKLTPGVYFVETQTEYTVTDSATLKVGEVKNNQSNAVVYVCLKGLSLGLINIDYKDVGTKLIGNHFPVLKEKADFRTVTCADGLFLTYICDPRKPTGVGLITAPAFTISTKPNTPVTPETLAACEAVARTITSAAKFTPLIVGGCEKI